MAAGAVDSQALKGRHGAGQHVVAVVEAGFFLVDRPLAKLDVADEIPGTGGQETGGDDRRGVLGGEDVSGELYAVSLEGRIYKLSP